MAPTNELPSPQANVQPTDYKAEIAATKGVTTKFIDPCKEASKASMDCLNRNDFDREKCSDFFAAYRECKKTWMEQRRQDRMKGV